MHIITQTPRLIIRTHQIQDDEPMITMLADEQVNAYLPNRTADDYRQLFHIAMLQPDAPFNRWVIIDKHDHSFIGMCLMRSMSKDNNELIEIGYSLPVEHWKKGIASETVSALIIYTRNFPEVKTLCAVTAQENIGSQAVLLKCGFVRGEDLEREGELLAYYELLLTKLT